MLYVGGRLVADKVIIADSFTVRLKGLLGKNSMPPGSALIIKPCNSIHTWFMRFDIDVLFVSETDRVIKMVINIRPFKIIINRVAAYVVELPSGTVEKYDVKPGDGVNYQPVDENKTCLLRMQYCYNLL